MSKRVGFAQVLSAALVVFAAANLSAQTNLLTNGHFKSRSAVQTVQTHDCSDQSSAANWNTMLQGPCPVTDSGVELETDVLLGNISPFFTLDAHLIHVRVEPLVVSPIGDPANSGIYQVFATSAPFHNRVLASVWVYVVRGQVGMGVGPATGFPLAAHNSVLGSWEHLVAISSSAPPSQFNIFGTTSSGSEFYADNAIVCPADTDSALQACIAAVGFSTGGAGNLASLTIVPSSVTGGQGATGILTLAAPAPTGGILATLLTSSGSASVPDSVMVPAGQTTATFPVTTTPVTSTTVATITAVSDNPVSANLTINPPGGGSGGGTPTGTILSLTISPSSVTGGQGATGTVTLTAAAPAGGIPVNLSSNNSAAGVPVSVTVQQGQTSATFPLTTTPVSSTTVATITASSANTVSANLTINPSGGGGGSGGGGTPTGTITSLTISPPSVTGGDTATGTVMLSAPAPAGGIPVSLSSNNGAAGVQPVVTVQQGQTSATFPVTTTPVSSTTTAMIIATSANSVSAPLTINPPQSGGAACVGSLTFNATSILGGLSLQGIVGLTAQAGISGQTVHLSSSSLFASVPATVYIAPFHNSTTFTVSTAPVAVLTTPIISASVAACATVTGSISLLP